MVVTPSWGSTAGTVPSHLCRQVTFTVLVLQLLWAPNTRSPLFFALASEELFSNNSLFRKFRNEQHDLQRAHGHCPGQE